MQSILKCGRSVQKLLQLKIIPIHPDWVILGASTWISTPFRLKERLQKFQQCAHIHIYQQRNQFLPLVKKKKKNCHGTSVCLPWKPAEFCVVYDLAFVKSMYTIQKFVSGDWKVKPAGRVSLWGPKILLQSVLPPKCYLTPQCYGLLGHVIEGVSHFYPESSFSVLPSHSLSLWAQWELGYTHIAARQLPVHTSNVCIAPLN